MVKDLVCGMGIDHERAGATYYYIDRLCPNSATRTIDGDPQPPTFARVLS
jgi:hypothetical protein